MYSHTIRGRVVILGQDSKVVRTHPNIIMVTVSIFEQVCF